MDNEHNTERGREAIREVIREEIREEIAASHRGINAFSIYSRTQSLIRTAASQARLHQHQTSALPTNNTTPPTTTIQPSTSRDALQEIHRVWGQQPSYNNKRRSQTGHPWRLKPSKSPAAKVLPDKSIYVWLLDNPLEEENVEEFCF